MEDLRARTVPGRPGLNTRGYVSLCKRAGGLWLRLKEDRLYQAGKVKHVPGLSQAAARANINEGYGGAHKAALQAERNRRSQLQALPYTLNRHHGAT
jgi:hypothetical protein